MVRVIRKIGISPDGEWRNSWLREFCLQSGRGCSSIQWSAASMSRTEGITLPRLPWVCAASQLLVLNCHKIRKQRWCFWSNGSHLKRHYRLIATCLSRWQHCHGIAGSVNPLANKIPSLSLIHFLLMPTAPNTHGWQALEQSSPIQLPPEQTTGEQSRNQVTLPLCKWCTSDPITYHIALLCEHAWARFSLKGSRLRKYTVNLIF